MGVENLEVNDLDFNVDSQKIGLSESLAGFEELSGKGKEKVIGQHREVNGLFGSYSGEVKNGKPDGMGTFTGGDFYFEGKFENGIFVGGGERSKIRNIKTKQVIEMVSYENGTYIGRSSVNNLYYKGLWDKELKLETCVYNDVEVRLQAVGKKYFLLNKSGDIVEIKGGLDPALVAMRIAKVIKIVTEEKKTNHVLLDYFEADNGSVLQADYNGKALDTNLLSDCPKLVGINARDLALRLNESRSDWAI